MADPESQSLPQEEHGRAQVHIEIPPELAKLRELRPAKFEWLFARQAEMELELSINPQVKVGSFRSSTTALVASLLGDRKGGRSLLLFDSDRSPSSFSRMTSDAPIQDF